MNNNNQQPPQLFDNIDNQVNPVKRGFKTFKLVGEAPNASFVREFVSLKALRQFKLRNDVKATPYIYHDGEWQRFVIIGSKVIPKSVLQSLLDSLNS